MVVPVKEGQFGGLDQLPHKKEHATMPRTFAESDSSTPLGSSATYTFASESVSEGHPDKVSDYIADSILDAYLEGDPRSRVACEVLCKEGNVIIAGEITSTSYVDHVVVARQAISEVGYTDDREAFCAEKVKILQLITKQSPDIAQGVDEDKNSGREQGAGDQGIMFGYATMETPELMPLPVVLAHRLTRGLAHDRKSGNHRWICPDAKSHVAVLYEVNKPVLVTDVLISTQHQPEITN
jgi:S-adenosylmethionine synthetase